MKEILTQDDNGNWYRMDSQGNWFHRYFYQGETVEEPVDFPEQWMERMSGKEKQSAEIYHALGSSNLHLLASLLHGQKARSA